MAQETPDKTAQQVSSAQDFKKKREERDKPQRLDLSSGLTVLLKRPNIKVLISSGYIPDQLASKIINMESKVGEEVEPKDVKDYLEFQKLVAKTALTSPEVVDEPKYAQNQIHIDDIDPDDLEEIFGFVMSGRRSETVDSFRDDAQGASAGPDLQEVSGDKAQ